MITPREGMDPIMAEEMRNAPMDPVLEEEVKNQPGKKSFVGTV